MIPQIDFTIEIYVENNFDGQIKDLVLPWEDWIKTWLKQLSIPDAKGYELSLRLTCDRKIQELNHQYRQKNQPTDVLAFAALEVEAPQIELDEPLYLGDIIISVDTALKQAIAQNHALETELAWLASHGVLHLLGWDHPDRASLEQMLDEQAKLLRAVGII